jgi:hypothetical protein
MKEEPLPPIEQDTCVFLPAKSLYTDSIFNNNYMLNHIVTLSAFRQAVLQ